MADHVHMLIKIPPKYAVAEVIGYIKGRGAIAVATAVWRAADEISMARSSGPRGYAVSTVGFEEEQIQKYIRHQETLTQKDMTRKEENDEAETMKTMVIVKTP